MDFEKYCENVEKVFVHDIQEVATDIKYCVFGVVEKAGYIVGKFKKGIEPGQKVSKPEILDEVGNFMFYLAMIFNLLLIDEMENGKDVVSRFNALVLSIQRPGKVVQGELHSIALSRTVSVLMSYIEQGHGDSVVSTMENVLHVVNMMCGSLGKTMSKVLDNNVDMLRKKYPSKFKASKLKTTSNEETKGEGKERKVVESRTTEQPKPTRED